MEVTPQEIKALRLKNGLTIQQAADMVHKARITWAKWEGGDAPIDLAAWELFKIKVGAKTPDIKW